MVFCRSKRLSENKNSKQTHLSCFIIYWCVDGEQKPKPGQIWSGTSETCRVMAEWVTDYLWKQTSVCLKWTKLFQCEWAWFQERQRARHREWYQSRRSKPGCQSPVIKSNHPAAFRRVHSPAHLNQMHEFPHLHGIRLWGGLVTSHSLDSGVLEVQQTRTQMTVYVYPNTHFSIPTFTRTHLIQSDVIKSDTEEEHHEWRHVPRSACGLKNTEAVSGCATHGRKKMFVFTLFYLPKDQVWTEHLDQMITGGPEMKSDTRPLQPKENSDWEDARKWSKNKLRIHQTREINLFLGFSFPGRRTEKLIGS